MFYIIDISCHKSVFPVDNVPASLGKKKCMIPSYELWIKQQEVVTPECENASCQGDCYDCDFLLLHWSTLSTPERWSPSEDEETSNSSTFSPSPPPSKSSLIFFESFPPESRLTALSPTLHNALLLHSKLNELEFGHCFDPFLITHRSDLFT